MAGHPRLGWLDGSKVVLSIPPKRAKHIVVASAIVVALDTTIRRPPDRPHHPFDDLIAVNFNEEFTVESAFRMPIDVVRRLASFSTHTDAWRLPIIQGNRATVPEMKEITSDLRGVPG